MDFTLNSILILILAQLLLSANPSSYEQSVFSLNRIRKHHEFHRLLSSGFVHSGWVHLFVNAFALFNFSPLLVDEFGSIATAIFFLLSVLGSSLVMLWKKRHLTDYHAVGASGGVSGLVMLAFFLNPEIRIGILLLPGHLPAYIFGIIFTLASIGLTYVKNPQHIAHEGHLGGLLTGGIIAGFYLGWNVSETPLMWLFALGVAPIFLWLFIPFRKEA